jgi:hypothetical protein
LDGGSLSRLADLNGWDVAVWKLEEEKRRDNVGGELMPCKLMQVCVVTAYAQR